MMLERLQYNLRDATRALRKQPAMASLIVIILALGIGANTALFSVVNSVLLRPLDYPDAQQLYVIHEVVPQWVNSYPLLSANVPDFLIWQKQARSFQEIAIAESNSMTLTGVAEPEQIHGTRGSANLLRLLGGLPALGRLFLPEEDEAGRGHVVILTDALWRSHFNAQASIVGRSITLDGIPYRVAGVLGRSFRLPGNLNGLSPESQFFVPLNGPKEYERGLIGEFDFTAIGRLKHGVTSATALSELNVIQSSIAEQAHTDLNLRAEISPLQREIVGAARRGLILLLGAVGAVLLMICVNIANLLFTRIPARMREAGIRKALGASEWQLVRQMLAESLLLALAGGAAGILVAHLEFAGSCTSARRRYPGWRRLTLTA
jgi:predicted permease